MAQSLQGCTYLHIPKTAGTALRNVGLDHKLPFMVGGHDNTLSNCNSCVVFSLREPWERFVSGFWEAKTFGLRDGIGNQPKYRRYKRGGYHVDRKRSPLEQEVYKIVSPDAMVTWLRDDHNRHRLYLDIRDVNPMAMLTAPLTHWLGDIASFEQHEHKIRAVFDQRHLTRIMQHHVGVSMPEDAFIARSRKLWDFTGDDYCSPENLSWFRDHFRDLDYQLWDYIQTRDYFITYRD